MATKKAEHITIEYDMNSGYFSSSNEVSIRTEFSPDDLFADLTVQQTFYKQQALYKDELPVANLKQFYDTATQYGFFADGIHLFFDLKKDVSFTRNGNKHKVLSYTRDILDGNSEKLTLKTKEHWITIYNYANAATIWFHELTGLLISMCTNHYHESDSMPSVCPECGSVKIIPIIYSEISNGDNLLRQKIKNRDVLVGKEPLTKGSPKWYCPTCCTKLYETGAKEILE